MTKRKNFEEIMYIEERLESKKKANIEEKLNIKKKITNLEEYTIYSYLFLKLGIITIIILFFDLNLLYLLVLLSLIFFILSFILSILALRYKDATDKNLFILIASFILSIIILFYIYLGYDIYNHGLNLPIG